MIAIRAPRIFTPQWLTEFLEPRAETWPHWLIVLFLRKMPTLYAGSIEDLGEQLRQSEDKLSL